MSRVMEEQIAEAEAETEQPDTEPETDDDEEGEEEAEAEPEAAGPPPIGPDEIRKAERAINAQRKRLGEILGADAVAHDCILCSGMGFLPGLPPIGTKLVVAEDETGIGVVAEEPLDAQGYRTAADKAVCDECDGLGQVVTGSKVPHAILAGCSKCAGNGWVTVARDAGVNAYVPPAPALPTLPPGMEPANMPPDSWGRAWGHQHYGVPPAQIPG